VSDIERGRAGGQAAERVGVPLVWHKLALIAPAGDIRRTRPAYSHMLCFSRSFRHQVRPAAAARGQLAPLGSA